MAEPVTIFLSYAHEDEDLLKNLIAHLSPLKRNKLVSEWYDRQIPAGTEWATAIDERLNTADIIILFISKDFLASSYCYEVEMPRALERHAAHEAAVIPLIAQPCKWDSAPFSKLNALPTDGKPISTWDNRDEAWVDVVNGIEKVAKSVQQAKADHERTSSDAAMQSFYQNLCEKGRAAMLNRAVEIAPYLDDLSQDKRIGLTLIGRPSEAVKNKLETLLARLKEVAPAHFYYEAPRFHFTILAMIDADDPPRVSHETAQRFVRPIREVLAASKPFEVEFRSLCTTPNSFILCGFPVDGGIEQIRDALRKRLHEDGLGAELDRRYKIQGAHITLGRFRVQEDFTPLIALLDEWRGISLGRIKIDQALLVLNDFYMSPDKVQVVEVFQIDAPEVVHNLPIRGQIIGRTNEHQTLLDTLLQAGKYVILASGFGGVGKSTLARMVAWTCVERRMPFRQIIWVDVRQYGQGTPPVLNSILDIIGSVVDPSGEIPLISSPDAKQKRVRDRLALCPSLLIIDNYESLLVNPAEERRINDFLNTLPVENTGLRVLITTREISGNLRRLPIEDVSLQQLSLEESIRFMKSRATPKHKLTDAQYARIWEMWFGLPKYMEIAVEQLTNVPFDRWESYYANLERPFEPNDRYFSDLMDPAWQRFTEPLRQILMAITLFVGEASYEALEAASGLESGLFLEAMGSDSAVSGAYIERTKSDGYRVHSLIQAYCQKHLNSEVYAPFRQEARQCFMNYYVSLPTAGQGAEHMKVLAKEIANIVEGAKTANELEAWDRLITLHEAMSTFLRFWGYWQERMMITVLAVKACQQLGKQEQLAQYLVYDLGWFYLRLEKLDDAERVVKEGLQIYTTLNNTSGIAQATRHLGKAALLKGLDEYYVPDTQWPDHFPEAERYYRESLNIQIRMQETGEDRKRPIADMHLDFGRLYWLDGQYLWKAGHRQNDQAQIDCGLAQLEESNRLNLKALDTFQALGDRRGIAKTYGNLGNTTKEIALLWSARQNWEKARQSAAEAQQHYQTSYNISLEIQRQDEVSHAIWGLAEMIRLIADHSELRPNGDDVRQLLEQALDYAQKAHEIYTALGGDKDINATQRLVEQLGTY